MDKLKEMIIKMDDATLYGVMSDCGTVAAGIEGNNIDRKLFWYHIFKTVNSEADRRLAIDSME